MRRDVVARYKRSVLGVLWTLLNPLGTMLVLAVVFSNAFGMRRGYAAYLLAGLLAWHLFSQTTVSAMQHLAVSAHLLRRIYLPPSVFAVSALGSALVNLALSLLPLFAIMLITGVPIRPVVLLLPVAVLPLAAFALGISLALSILAVYFHDASELYSIALTPSCT